MIYYNSNTINDWNFGDDNIIKVYHNGAVVFYKFDSEQGGYKVCYAVVDDISKYSETEFEDVYDKATEKWYKLNNLNQYEEYGVYASGRTSCSAASFTELTDIIAQSTTALTNHNITVTPAVGAFSKIRIDTTKSATTSSYCWATFTPTPSGSEVLGFNMSSIGAMNGYGNNKNYVTDANGSQTFAHWVDDNNTIVEIDIAALSNNQASELYLLFYQENCNPAAFSFYMEATDCVTTYNGKLTIDDGYEYEWNGSSWVNLGEVSGSSRLPIGYTEVEYIQNTGTSYLNIAFTPNQDTRVVCDMQLVTQTDYPRLWGAGKWNNANGIQPNYEGGYFQMSWFGKTSWTSYTSLPTNLNRHTYDVNKNYVYVDGTLLGSNTYTTMTASDPMAVFTYINAGRPSTTNDWNKEHFRGKLWSFQVYDNGTLVRDLVPCIKDSDNTVGAYDIVNDVFYTVPTGYTTDKLIAGAETGSTEYPKYYSEKSEPLDNLTFNTLAEAQAYAEANCVYDGMHATIGADRYYFDSSDENGWAKVTEYYIVEDVTPNAASGWTISGSSTYNPDLSYYDDFDLETDWTSYAYKIAKVTIFGYDHFTYYLRAYSSYSAPNAYLMASNIDELSSDPTSMTYSSNSAVVNTYDFRHTAGSAVNLNNYRRVTYNNLDKTVEHTFYVVFYGRKYSNYTGDATILIPKEQTNENWEQVTFSASSNVASSQKNLYIDDNYTSSNGSTQYFYYRWMIGLPSGSHSSYVSYSNYNYCPNVTSSTFTSVAGEQRQVNFTYDNTSSKTLTFRLTDGSNVLTPSNTVYYNMTYYNSCGTSSSSSNVTFPRSNTVKVGGRFRFANSSNRHYIYGYSPNISLNTDYYVDNYQSTFDITYTKLSDEAVTITYTTYDPSDVETPAFKTDITYPYSGGTTSSTTLTSYTVPYTYSYKVNESSGMFSAATQTYTAGQSSRTISFVLYPNNREFATVADMEAYQYAWEGMKAYVGDTNYEYKNGEWVEYTGTIWLDPSATNALFSIGHYWGENYKMVFTTYLSGSYSGDYGSFWQYNEHSPIEFSFYSNGFFYDFHNPTSTTAPNVYTGDYSWRIMKNSTLSSYENGQILNIILSNGAVRVELESTGAAIVTGSTSVTAQNWYSGLYLPNIGLNNANAKCHLSHIQIYNGNNELVNDFKFIKNNGVVGSQEISIYDSVTNTTYNNTNSNTPVYHIET